MRKCKVNTKAETYPMLQLKFVTLISKASLRIHLINTRMKKVLIWGRWYFLKLTFRLHAFMHTEHRGQVANISASYLGNPGFKSGPGDRLS
jgi:hypothetical protein